MKENHDVILMNLEPINNDAMIRYFSGNATEEDQRQLLAWINESPDNEQQLFILKDIYEASLLPNAQVGAQTEDEWRKMQKTILRSQPKKNIRQSEKKRIDWTDYIRKYVAIFMIGALLGSLVAYFAHTGNTAATTAVMVKPFEISTEKGERATVHLPDGSKVVLNACSFLSYPADFGIHSRELSLTGEGYFDVQNNPDLPFTVKTSGLNIKAFGTIFNVRAYSDEDVIETTLVEGKVSIETQTNKSIVSLNPDQVITIPKELIRANLETEYSSRTTSEKTDQKQDESVRVSKKSDVKTKEAILNDKINPEVYTSWIDNKWVIETESLESLAKKIERKYDVIISLKGETVRKYIFSGTLKNYPLEQILETIRLSAPIQYSISENIVLISEDKQLIKTYEKLIHSPF